MNRLWKRLIQWQWFRTKSSEVPGVSVVVPPNKDKDHRELEGTKLADCNSQSICVGLV